MPATQDKPLRTSGESWLEPVPQAWTPRKSLMALFTALALGAGALSHAQAGQFEYRMVAPKLSATPTSAPPPSEPPAPPPPPAQPPAALTLSTTSISFGELSAHTSDARQVLLTNSGGQPLTFSSAAAVTGDTAFTAGATSCSQSLAPGAECSVEVLFSPTSTGSFSGTLTLSTNLAGSPHTLSLQGSAFNPLLMSGGAVSPALQYQPYSVNMREYLSISKVGTPEWDLVSWSAPNGLPAGLTLNAQTGVVSGTLTTASTYSFDIEAQYKQNTARANYSLTVAPDSDPAWNAVSVLLNFEGTPGTTSFTEPVKGLTLNVLGSAQLSSNAKFGQTSLSVVGGYVGMPGARFAVSTRPFTYELFVRRNTASSGSFTLLETRPLNTNGSYITLTSQSGGNLVYYTNTADRISTASGVLPADGAWHHVAYSRDAANTGRLFVNGQQVGSWADSTNYVAASTVWINRNAYGVSQVGGLVDAVRLTDGQARYVAPFTPPAYPYATQ